MSRGGLEDAYVRLFFGRRTWPIYAFMSAWALLAGGYAVAISSPVGAVLALLFSLAMGLLARALRARDRRHD